jgi:hypothetical protein
MYGSVIYVYWSADCEVILKIINREQMFYSTHAVSTDRLICVCMYISFVRRRFLLSYCPHFREMSITQFWDVTTYSSVRIHQATRRHNPEYNTLHIIGRGNFKFYRFLTRPINLLQMWTCCLQIKSLLL